MNRITLNAYNNKELVVLPGHSVQIWKAGEIQGSFMKHELKELSRTLLTRITNYLQTGEHNGEPFDTLPTHMVHYIELRNKPFILIERDDHFVEINGIPAIEQVYLGNTAWQTLLHHKHDIISALY